MKKREGLISWVKTLLIAVVAVLFVLPFIWMILSSLKTTKEVFASPYHWLPAEFMWSNYAKVWTDESVSLLKSFFNSLKIVVVSTAGSLIIASMAAYAFAKIKFAGKNLIFMLFLASMMIPIQVTIVPRFMVFKTMDLYNTLWAIILPGLFNATAVFLLRQTYIGLPDDLVGAAKIDGAGHPRIFLQILMPLTKSSIVSLVVLSFIQSWNEYLSPLVFLTDKNLYTVAQAIRWWMLDDAARYELTMAVASSAIVPVAILFIACQKYFVEGIATSGVKG